MDLIASNNSIFFKNVKQNKNRKHWQLEVTYILNIRMMHSPIRTTCVSDRTFQTFNLQKQNKKPTSKMSTKNKIFGFDLTANRV